MGVAALFRAFYMLSDRPFLSQALFRQTLIGQNSDYLVYINIHHMLSSTFKVILVVKVLIKVVVT